MRVRVFAVVGQGFKAMSNGDVVVPEFSFTVTKAEIREASQVFPYIVLRGSRFLAFSDQKTQHVVIQVSSQLAVEVTQPKVFAVLNGGFFVFLAHAKAFGQPEMSFGVLWG